MKKRILGSGLIVLALLVVLLVFSRRKGQRDLEEIIKDGRITVLIDSGEHGFKRDSSKVAGFQYEVVKMFADELGVELVILQEPDLEKGNSELIKGDCDIVVSLQPLVTDSTLGYVSVYPLIETNLMLVQLPDSAGKLPVSVQYELHNRTISLVKGSPFRRLIDNLAEDMAIEPVINETENLNPDAMMQSIVQKKDSFTVCPDYLSRRMMKKYPDLNFSVPLTFYLQLGWTVRNNSPKLKERLDAFTSQFVGTAQYWSLYATYFTNY